MSEELETKSEFSIADTSNEDESSEYEDNDVAQDNDELSQVTYPKEMINAADHDLDEILSTDYYQKYKHEKLDIPEDFQKRFLELCNHINSVSDRKMLTFFHLKPLIARYFPRGKKDTKTKERVDETVARVYTEASRRVMKLMFDEGDTHALKIDPMAFVREHKDIPIIRQVKGDELRNVQAFYRAIYIAHHEIKLPCQGFRNHFMRIGSLLENSGMYYATGGRPAKTTLLRKELIDKLTQSQRSRRNAKKLPLSESGSDLSSFPLSPATTMQLDSDKFLGMGDISGIEQLLLAAEGLTALRA